MLGVEVVLVGVEDARARPDPARAAPSTIAPRRRELAAVQHRVRPDARVRAPSKADEVDRTELGAQPDALADLDLARRRRPRSESAPGRCSVTTPRAIAQARRRAPR